MEQHKNVMNGDSSNVHKKKKENSDQIEIPTGFWMA